MSTAAEEVLDLPASNGQHKMTHAPNGIAFTLRHPSQPSNWTVFCVYRDDDSGLVKLVRRERRTRSADPQGTRYAWTSPSPGQKGRAEQVADQINLRATSSGVSTFTGPHPVWVGSGLVDCEGPVKPPKDASALDATVLSKHEIADPSATIAALVKLVGDTDAATIGATFDALMPREYASAQPKAAPEKRPETPGYFRPSGERYWPRIVDGAVNDVEMLRTARANKMPVLFVGVPGTGKSSCVEAAFPDVVALDGTGDTGVEDFVGGFVPDPDTAGKYLWADGPLPIAMQTGVPLFVDEISRINPQVLTILYPLMDGRDRVTIPGRPASVGGPHVIAAPGFYVVGAYNPDLPGCRIDEPLSSRFAIHIEFTTDYTIAARLKVPATAMKAARKLDGLRRDSNHPLQWAPQLRELIRFRDQASTFTEAFAWRALLGAAPDQDRPIVAEVVAEFVGIKDIQRLATDGAA